MASHHEYAHNKVNEASRTMWFLKKQLKSEKLTDPDRAAIEKRLRKEIRTLEKEEPQLPKMPGGLRALRNRYSKQAPRPRPSYTFKKNWNKTAGQLADRSKHLQEKYGYRRSERPDERSSHEWNNWE
jgi:hypothetical protein